MSCDDKLMDEVLELLIEKAAPLAEERMEYTVDNSLKFSEKHKREMRRLFRKERSKQRRGKFTRYAGRAIAGAAAFIVVSGVIFSIDGNVGNIVNFFLEENKQGTDIHFDGVLPDPNEPIKAFPDFEVGYVPEGYELVKKDISEGIDINVRFSNGDKTIVISKMILDVLAGIDTENSTKEEMLINGMEAFYYYREEYKRSILIWHDDEYLYEVITYLDKAETVKIAENIKNNN